MREKGEREAVRDEREKEGEEMERGGVLRQRKREGEIDRPEEE